MQFLKEDIQEKILNKAEEVFYEKGYNGTSMREIASRSGITVSNIYHYFTNKDEMFHTILKPVLNDLYALVLHHIKKEEMQKFVTEYIAFETAGWKELMNA